MRNLLIPLAALLVAACGSNAPPAPSADNATTHIPGMDMPAPTGDQDRDFAKAMIIHHQGAIDMSRRQLAKGSDPGLRKMASEIILAQQREIAELNAYLDRTGGR